MGFRARLFAEARPYDLHVNDAGRSYALAALVFGVAALVSAAGWDPAGPPRYLRRSDPAA
jgi:hypothetical protein